MHNDNEIIEESPTFDVTLKIPQIDSESPEDAARRFFRVIREVNCLSVTATPSYGPGRKPLYWHFDVQLVDGLPVEEESSNG